MTVVLVFESGNTLESIAFDATPKEDHSREAEVTSNPVESGSNMTDHVRQLPNKISIECLVTDYPSTSSLARTIPQATFLGSGKPEEGRSTLILNKLDELQRTGALVRLDTGIRSYDNLVIKSVRAPRDASLKKALRLSIEFQTVRFASSRSVEIKLPLEKGAQKKLSKGAQNTRAATPQELAKSKRSALVGILGLK